MSADSIPRYCRARQLPPYSYVTGLFPHPTRDQSGHSFGKHEAPPPPLLEEAYRENEVYAYALDLFNHGFYWEAHEEWESLWHVAGRHGRTADFLKGLIKLAAAGVKAREGRPAGVKQHAERAVELFSGVHTFEVPHADSIFGLDLAELIRATRGIAANAQQLAGDGQPNAERRLPVVLRLNAS
jgi:uncharacterized protein